MDQQQLSQHLQNAYYGIILAFLIEMKQLCQELDIDIDTTISILNSLNKTDISSIKYLNFNYTCNQKMLNEFTTLAESNVDAKILRAIQDALSVSKQKKGKNPFFPE